MKRSVYFLFYILSFGALISYGQCSIPFIGTPDGLGVNGINFQAPSQLGGFSINYYQWDFGDGSATAVLSDSTVHHNYPLPGSYNVILTIYTNVVCIDSSIVVVSDPVTGCAGSFTIQPSSSNWNAFTLTAQAAGGTAPYSYMWNFGATAQTENFQMISGPQEICLTIVDMLGCTSTHCDTLYEGMPNFIPIYYSTIDTVGCNGTIAVSVDLIAGECQGALVSDPAESVDFNSMWIDGDTLFFNTCGNVNSLGIADSDGNLCNYTVVDSISSQTAGLNDLNSLGVKIYPNPSSEYITLELTNFSNELDLHVYNSIGQEIERHKITSSKVMIRLPEQPGMYQFVFIDEMRTYRYKIIKN